MGSCNKYDTYPSIHPSIHCEDGCRSCYMSPFAFCLMRNALLYFSFTLRFKILQLKKVLLYYIYSQHDWKSTSVNMCNTCCVMYACFPFLNTSLVEWYLLSLSHLLSSLQPLSHLLSSLQSLSHLMCSLLGISSSVYLSWTLFRSCKRCS